GRVAVARTWPLARSDGPAGDLFSTAADQIRYARLHLADGRAPDGTRLLPEQAIRRMRRPTAGTASGGRLGHVWVLREIDGVWFAFHGGTAIGQQAAFEIAPECDFAVTVLTNAQHGFVLCEEVTAWARQAYLGMGDETWPGPATDERTDPILESG